MSFPDTKPSLLVKVRDSSDRESWQKFLEIYEPVVYRTAIARGLQHSDAQDLTQQVFLSVANAIGDWDHTKGAGKFRHWLSRVTRNAILNALMRRPSESVRGGTSAALDLQSIASGEKGITTLIDMEYRREIFQLAASQVQGEFHAATWHAFQRTVVEGASVEAVAAELGKSLGAVYTARSRVMLRLREVVSVLEGQDR